MRGRVVRGDEPVWGAAVEIESETEDSPSVRVGASLDLSDETGNDGSYAIEHVPPGEATIYVEKEGTGLAEFAELVIDVPDSAQFECDVRLPAGEIRGTVTRAADRTPVPGAVVSLYSQDRVRRRSRPGPWVRCDADGRYRVRGLEAGSYSVSVDPPSDRQGEGRRDPLLGSLTEKRRVGIEVGEGEAVTVDFELEPGGTALLRVIDPSGAAMPGEKVLLVSEWEDGMSTRSTREGFTDGSGIARIEGVIPGLYSASLERREYASQSSPVVAVRAGGAAVLELELKEAFMLRVRVLDPEGSPVPGARGSFDAEPGRGYTRLSSAEEGVLTGYLVAGEYDLGVSAKGFSRSKARVLVGPGAPEEVVVRLEREPEPK